MRLIFLCSIKIEHTVALFVGEWARKRETSSLKKNTQGLKALHHKQRVLVGKIGES